MLGVGGTAISEVERLFIGPLAEEPETPVMTRLVQMRHRIDLLELEFSKVAAEFAAGDEWDSDNHESAVGRIRVACKMGSGAAADRICVGEEMEKLPLTVDALECGRIGFAHVAAMARTARAINESRTGQSFDEVPLLSKAVKTPISRFIDLCMHARHQQDPEGAGDDEAKNARRRELVIGNPGEDGMVILRGLLDAAAGAVVRTALEPLARKAGPDDRRLKEERMGDALVELAMHAMDTGSIPQRASQRTHLQVTVPLETLLGARNAPAAELEHCSPISGRLARMLACDSSVSRIVFGPDAAVVEVGRARRVVSAAQRRALNAQQKHCQWPGCDRSASYTVPHHLVHWAEGGATDLPNLLLLCFRHHWRVHMEGWQIMRTDQGITTVPPPTGLAGWARGPDGWVIA
ncbi:MAG: hypothetical protein QOE92_1598 [Chloroflexota bacterium]|jgi:hypothetical protein|nr:hypothetical protein [Chloroflexota bacterium]